MQLVRAYELPDGDLIFQAFDQSVTDWPADQLATYQVDERYQQGTIRYFQHCGAAPADHTGDCCDFPPTAHIDQWYCVNGQLAADRHWETVLIPWPELARKHRARCLRTIATALQQPELNLRDIGRWQWEYEMCRSWGKQECPEIYEVALRNLDVDQLAKPRIRQQLTEKIATLKAQKGVS